MSFGLLSAKTRLPRACWELRMTNLDETDKPTSMPIDRLEGRAVLLGAARIFPREGLSPILHYSIGRTMIEGQEGVN